MQARPRRSADGFLFLPFLSYILLYLSGKALSTAA